MAEISTLGQSQARYQIGGLGLFLVITSTVGLGWIATLYGLFPQYSFPILFSIMLGIFGLFMAVGTGALSLRATPFEILTILFSTLGLLFIIAFGAIATLIQAPQAQVGALIVTLPAVIAIMFYGFVGVQEEMFWRGLFMTLRKIFPGFGAFVLIALFIAVGGMAFHQFVAYILFQGTIFNTPGYFIWIGLSWIAYSIMLEVSRNFGANALTHFSWNVAITILNLQQLGGGT